MSKQEKKPYPVSGVFTALLHFFGIGLIFTILTMAVIFYGIGLPSPPGKPNASPKIADLRYIDANTKDDAKNLNILFIGNSYTSYNDMPGMILKIAEADPENTYNIHIQSITIGGALLKDHWNNINTHKIIDGYDWDFIVLQQQSVWALYDNTIKSTRDHVGKFVKKAKEKQANIVLYETWLRQPNSKWYSAPFSMASKNPTYMHRQIRQHTARIARTNDIVYAPVGEYWYNTLQTNPEINLYMPDGSHPNKTGSFLTALVFYKYLTGNPMERSSYIPEDVTEPQATIIKSLVAQEL